MKRAARKTFGFCGKLPNCPGEVMRDAWIWKGKLYKINLFYYQKMAGKRKMLIRSENQEKPAEFQKGNPTVFLCAIKNAI